MNLRIEKLEDCASGGWGYFVAVYKNEECVGTVMTDGTLTPKECYENLLNNQDNLKIKVMKAKTEKIKVKINVAPRYKEVEVSFPYYVKDGYVLIKFFDERKGIMVADYDFSKQIQYMRMPEEWLSFKPTTEDIFNKAFDKVMNFLIKNK